MNIAGYGFRPLTGTLLSKQANIKRRNDDGRKCFRPLTGTLLSKLKTLIVPFWKIKVSVPSRGLSYLNQQKQKTKLRKKEFPSPHGDSLI